MTELELFNITLSMFDKELTQSDIESETPSKELRLCLKYKDIAIVRAMREFDWSFLIVPLEMDYTQLEVDHFGFDYSYALPTGVLKVVHNFTDYPYEVKRRILHTDALEPVVYGIMEELPEDEIPLDFYELIAMALAYQIAPMLVPDGRLDKVIFQKYTWALNSLLSAECHNNSREA